MTQPQAYAEQKALSDMYGRLCAAEREIERLQSSGIHTCHDKCQNWICLLRRENDSLKSKLAVATLAIEKLGLGWLYWPVGDAKPQRYDSKTLDQIETMATEALKAINGTK